MKKIVTILFAAVLAYSATFNLETEWKSKRISKGKVSNPEAVFLVNAKISLNNGLYYSAFIIDDLTDYNESRGVDEFDVEQVEHKIGYARKLDGISYIKSLKIDLGYLYTDYRENMKSCGDPEHEAYVKLTTGLPFSPGVKFNIDVEHECWYLNAFVSSTWRLSQTLKLKESIDIYWYDSKMCWHEFGEHRAMLTCIYYKVNLLWSPIEGLSLGPLAEVSVALDDRVRAAYSRSSKNNKSNALVGFKIDYEF